MAEKWEADKDPLDVKKYGFEWNLLDGQTITGSNWSIKFGGSALILGTSTISANITKVVVSGGTVGIKYQVENTITTSGGDTFNRTGILSVKDL
jgi:hypothetical protein